MLPIGRGKCNNPFYGSWANDPVRGEDDATRSGFGNHAYTKLAGQNNYDACMKQWRSWLEQLILTIVYFIVWLILLIITFGLAPPLPILLDRAQGWLVNLTQPGVQRRDRRHKHAGRGELGRRHTVRLHARLPGGVALAEEALASTVHVIARAEQFSEANAAG